MFWIFNYLLCWNKCRQRFAIVLSDESSGCAGSESTSTPRLKYSSFLRWKRTSTLLAANDTSLTVKRVGFGRVWIRYKERLTMGKFVLGQHTGWEVKISGSSSGWGNAAWLLTRSRTLGIIKTKLCGEAVTKERRGSIKWALNKFAGVMSRSPALILGCVASTKGPI